MVVPKDQEYWYFYLFIVIVNIITSVLEALIFWDSYLLEYGPISNTISLILLILICKMHAQEGFMT